MTRQGREVRELSMGPPSQHSDVAPSGARRREVAENRRSDCGQPDVAPAVRSRLIAPVSATVLIVDDNQRFRVCARAWLEADGYAVVAEAADGGAALEAARLHRPAVVLLDIQLPDMSGLSVAERLTLRPDPPAVVLTSTHDPADFGDALVRCGARGFVLKAELSGERLSRLLAG